MAEYSPTSRRPIARTLRRSADLATNICVRFHISPDVISFSSIVASLGAALCFWNSMAQPWLLVVGPVLCYLRLWFNMLDGMVAIAGNGASLRGEIVNDLPDRISDVVIFAGVAHSGWMHPAIGYWAAILAFFTAYVGLMGQAIAGGRQFGGVMSKPWRMVWLSAGCWFTFLLRSCAQSIQGFSVLDWTCLIIVAGCIQTIALRLKRILRAVAALPK